MTSITPITTPPATNAIALGGGGGGGFPVPAPAPTPAPSPDTGFDPGSGVVDHDGVFVPFPDPGCGRC